MKNTITRSAALLFFGICVGAHQVSQLADFSNESESLSRATALNETKKQKDTLMIANQLPTFGFDNARANLTFLSFLQYFGDDSTRKQTGYGLSANFFKNIIRDDPYYKDFYVFLTNSVSFNAAQPEKSVEIMTMGLKFLSPGKPDSSYYVWRYKGVDELLFLGDSRAARQSFESAAIWASKSDLPESELISSISQQTADFLAQNPESKTAQIGAWSSILSTALDDDTRRRAVNSIQELGGEVVVGENGSVTVKYAQSDQKSES